MDLINLKAVGAVFKDGDGRQILMGGTNVVAAVLHQIFSPTIGADEISIITDGDANIRIEREGADFYLSLVDGATGLDIPGFCRLPVLERKMRKAFAENPELEGNLSIHTDGHILSITHYLNGFFLSITTRS